MPSAARDRAARASALTLCAGLALAACSDTPSPSASRAVGPIVLAGDGLRVGQTGKEIGFGRAEAGAVTAAVKLMGRQPTSRQTLRECRAGPIDTAHWDTGITMYFTSGDFVGWATSAPGLRSAKGVGVGDTAAEVSARTGLAATPGAVRVQDDITLLFDADGRVTRLRAGTTCDGG